MIHALDPFKIQYSSLLLLEVAVMSVSIPLSVSVVVAVVDAADASLPLPGSDNMKQPNLAPVAQGVRNNSFCSCVPYFSIGVQYKELLTLMMMPVEAHPLEISSIAMA